MKTSYCVIKHNSFLPYVYHNNNHVPYFICLQIVDFKSPSFHIVEKNVPLVFFANRVNGKKGDEMNENPNISTRGNFKSPPSQTGPYHGEGALTGPKGSTRAVCELTLQSWTLFRYLILCILAVLFILMVPFTVCRYKSMKKKT